MIEFDKQIAEKWNLSESLSEMICNAFQKGDTPYYLAEYCPDIAVESSLSQLWQIYDFLGGMNELGSKKKRIITALKKGEKLTPAIEKRVALSTNSFELDDMLLPLRPNPRSRGQLAIKKGLGPLADIIVLQDEQSAPIDELAGAYIGKDPSLKTIQDVISGVKDILAERFAYDDTVRSMARDFAAEDGCFEVQPKEKHDPRFARFEGKQVSLSELTKEDILTLLAAEEQKALKCKLVVQLFRITELLRHHVIQNPDYSGFDFLCEVIDDSWVRLLQPIIERDVKIRIREDAETWAEQRIAPELEKHFSEEQRRGTVLAIDAAHPKYIYFIVVNGHGDLLGATSEKRLPDGKVPSYERLRQFYLRHRPSEIVICDNEQAATAEAMVSAIIGADVLAPKVSRQGPDASLVAISECEWVRKKYETLLDNDTRKLYAAALLYCKPLVLIPGLGTDFYSLHPLQKVISKDRFVKIVNRIVTDAALHKGILIKDLVESRLSNLEIVTPEMLLAIRSTDNKEPFASKIDLLNVPGMTEVVFRNIAGFIMLPNAEDFRDRSIIHPDYFSWVEEASEQLNVSLDTIMNDPETMRSFAVEDFIKKIYIEKKLISQIRTCLQAASSSSSKIKRKLKLSEFKEGSIVSGRVTNITPFGVFVNVNAVCDGLIHISQLADDYVESPEQVVSLHEKVDVRILKIDVKKRRISLSMKNLGKKGPRVKPSAGHLNTLAEHFKNR